MSEKDNLSKEDEKLIKQSDAIYDLCDRYVWDLTGMENSLFDAGCYQHKETAHQAKVLADLLDKACCAAEALQSYAANMPIPREKRIELALLSRIPVSSLEDPAVYPTDSIIETGAKK